MLHLCFVSFIAIGCFALALVILLLYDFFPVCFAGLVKECYPPACAFFKFGRSRFLACKAGGKPVVLKGDSVPFCVNSHDSFIDIAT